MSPTSRRAPGSDASASAEAESWFLERGLPSVLTPRGRWRRLWSRSAPLLAGNATMQIFGILIVLTTGGREVYLEEVKTPTHWVVLGIILAALPVAVLVGFVVSRLPHTRIRTLAGIASTAIAALAGVFDGGPAELASTAEVVVVIFVLTGLGIGSVLVWAVRTTLSHFATVGGLAVRALPVVLLTALVFFNTYVWLMSVTISGPRLFLAIAFLVSIAASFVISGTVERVKPMLRSAAALPRDCESLADTPFAAMPDAPEGSSSPGFTWAERANVVFVLATSQLVQITVVAVVTAAIYLILGLIVLTPELLKEWTHVGTPTSNFLGWTIPIPGSLVHICVVLGALTFMYISARAVGDGEYRSSFLDPLIDDLHATLIARNRYHRAIAAVDAADLGD